MRRAFKASVIFAAGALATGAIAKGSPSAAPPASTRAELRLGQELFEDKGISVDKTVSCASCHVATHGFADIHPLAIGAKGRVGTRHAPSLLHTNLYACYFWDCRAKTLDAQVVDAFLDPTELGFTTTNQVVARIQAEPRYGRVYTRLYGAKAAELPLDTVLRPIVAFEVSLAGRSVPLDRYLKGDKSALTLLQRQGLAVFRGSAHCADCHTIGAKSASLTDGRFHESPVGLAGVSGRLPELVNELEHLNAGQRGRLIQTDPAVAALGRFAVTLDPRDIGKFRTPTLRDVATTGPYMHDGSIKTLHEAVDLELYYRGTQLGSPIILSPTDRAVLMTFLDSLTSKRRIDNRFADRGTASSTSGHGCSRGG